MRHPREVLPRLAEARLAGQLGRFARRGRSLARLEHVVLPAPIREQLIELRDAVRNRNAVYDRWRLADRHAIGRGIVALFNGPPGTGKTMTANVLANELGLPLYRIDTSAVVDRYVGETEKNLMRLFEEASASRAALLFDEADSLFGKRVEAHDASDRYANMQINVLLNLIEDYDGFVVLTTNMKGALDSAFLRRIVFKVSFELPDVEERAALWEYHLPPEIPRTSDVDLMALAREFERVSGGDIKNAVLRAVLQAGAEGGISQAILHRSMANELRANGSLIPERKEKVRGSSLV
jgi:SpoVK/Ycf46/Vps4 family AAA+-type ATPase